MKLTFCVSCGARNNLHDRHLVPRAVGGGSGETITLCTGYHATIHAQTYYHGDLVRIGKARAAAERAAGEQPGGWRPWRAAAILFAAALVLYVLGVPAGSRVRNDHRRRRGGFRFTPKPVEGWKGYSTLHKKGVPTPDRPSFTPKP